MSEIHFEGKSIHYPDIYVAKLSGCLPHGTEANEKIQYCYEQLSVDIRKEGITKLVLDFSQLDYEYSNALAALWVKPLLLEIVHSCIIIARMDTRKAVESLLEIGPCQIPIVEDLEAALRFLQSTNNPLN